MKIGLKHIGASVLFVMGIADACAGSSGNHWDMREWAQVFQIQRTAVDHGERGSSHSNLSDERRRGDGNRQDSGFGNQAGNARGNVDDNAQKNGRMSPEERRALRRQIDEAGHDIYRPKR